MKVIILENADSVAIYGATIIVELIRNKRNAVLGLASGSTPVALYHELGRRYQEGDISFKEVITFNLDEYFDIKPDDSQSYRSYMNREFFSLIDINLDNTHLPDNQYGAHPDQIGPEYERAIRGVGGVDLQLLGIGTNGHIGFNEPTSSLASRTRIKTLTRKTLEDNNRFFNKKKKQPHLAMTMGIGSIMDSRQIMLLATGNGKASAIRNTIEGPVSTMCPASILQFHKEVIVIIDEAAAVELEHGEYYKWVYRQQQSLIEK